MEFTFSWLKRFLKTDASLEAVLLRLNEIGLEVDGVIDKAQNLRDFVIAEILEVKPHPNSNKLTICQVFDGNQNLQIVCGASNVRNRLKVVLAPLGTIIPVNNLKIKLVKIQNIESQGMLCSAAELLIEPKNDGIIELPEDAPVGEKFAQYMNLDDPIIKVEITPNRGDCLGVYGIARDLAGAGIGELLELNYQDFSSKNNDLDIQIENNENCSAYFATVIENIKNHQTPKWLSDYLKAIGVKSISAPVDICNYIMYSFGQPLHVYDFDKIQGRVCVRRAKLSEKFISLDDQTYSLKENDLVISDEKEVLALAGIIGSQEGGYHSRSCNLLLESANFNNNNIVLSGRSHAINTQARYRFERKIDHAFVERANNLAIQMILEICGGNLTKKYSFIHPYVKRTILFNLGDIETLGGIYIEKNNSIEIVSKLGFKLLSIDGEDCHLEIPSWRNDISISEDIIEEILRIYGYHNILPTNFIERNITKVINKEDLIKKVTLTSVELGYNEVVTWSFMDKNTAATFHEVNDDLEISNPISNELNYMRSTIISNLLEIIKKNQARGIEDLSLFEIGPIFSRTQPLSEHQSFAATLVGYNTRNNIHHTKVEYDVYNVKSLVEEILNLYGYQLSNLITSDETPQYFHPKRSLSIYLGKQVIGHFGEIHPLILKDFGIKKRVVAAEIFIDKVPYKPKKNKVSFSNYQAVERDFAFIASIDLKAGDLLKIICKIDPLIKTAEVFDVYQDASLGDDKKSIAIKVKILSETKTLNENEIKHIYDKIIEKANDYGANLRG